MLPAFLAAYLVLAQGDAEVAKALQDLEASLAQQRHEAQLRLGEILRPEHQALLLDAVRRSGPELRARLTEVLGARTEFVSLLGNWLQESGPESMLARDALLKIWAGFRGKTASGSEEGPTDDPLDSFFKIWVRLPPEPFSLLQLLDNYHRFGALKKPFVLDPWGPFGSWMVSEQGREGFAGPLLLDLFRKLAGVPRPKALLRDFSSFLWLSLDSAPISEEEAFLRLIRGWKAQDAEVRRLATLGLGLLGFGPSEEPMCRELLQHGPSWEEALVGLTTGAGVSPHLRQRDVLRALLMGLIQSRGHEREIAYTLHDLGRVDSRGESVEPLLLEFHQRAQADEDRLAIEFALAKLGFASAVPRLLRRVESIPSPNERARLALDLLGGFGWDSWPRDTALRGLESADPDPAWAWTTAKWLRREEDRREIAEAVARWAERAASSPEGKGIALAGEAIFRASLFLPHEMLRAPCLRRLGEIEDAGTKARFAAIAVLGRLLGSEPSLDEWRSILFRELERCEETVSRPLARALGRISNEDLRNRLCDVVLDGKRERDKRERALLALRESIPAMRREEREREILEIQNRLSSAQGEDREFAEVFSAWEHEMRSLPLEGENLLDRDELGSAFQP